MIRLLANITAAEVVKLRGLPALVTTVLATIGAAIALTAAIAASSTTPTDAVRVTLLTIPFLQIGPILIGVLTVATEYQGSQIRTTVTATPNRLLLLAGKTLAYLGAAAITSGAAVGVGLITATITLTFRDTKPAGDVNGLPVAGATAYLVLIGLLSLALTILLHSLVPPLVTILSLVLIASPLISNYTEQARWLPDRAGGLLYLANTDTVLTPAAGAFVLLAWIITTATAATLSFTTRDA